MNDIKYNEATILAVDDEPINLKLLEGIFKNNNYTSLELETDPRNVLARYEANRPDLILMDINMPHLNGYQVIEQLMALNDPLLPPILVLTAQNSEEVLLQALEAGARDFLSKPFNIKLLLMRVRNLLEAQLDYKALYTRNEELEKVLKSSSS